MKGVVTRLRDVAPQAWRNGGGVTRELLAWPSADAWRVRLSVADIEADGPFSAFAGVQRWFTVLEGAGVELVIGGVLHRLLRASEPLCFDGSASTTCTLIDGPTRDLNLMLRGAQGSLQRVAPGQPWRPDGASAGLYTAVPGTCLHGDSRSELEAGSLLWFASAPATLTFHAAEAGAWWITATATP